MKLKMNAEQLKNHCEKVLAKCSQEKREWVEKFNTDAMHALSWSDGLFLVCATEAVYDEVLGALNNDVSVEDIVKYTKNEILNKARFVQNSSSAGSNRCEQTRLQAKAELLSTMAFIND